MEEEQKKPEEQKAESRPAEPTDITHPPNPLPAATEEKHQEATEEQKETPTEAQKEEPRQEPRERISIKNRIKNFYDKKYKALLIIPFLLLILAISQISFQAITTGEFISKGVGLKGGLTITIPTTKQVDVGSFESQLLGNFPDKDISVRLLTRAGQQFGVTVDADVNIENEEEVDSFLNEIDSTFKLTREQYSVEFIGSSLGESFFREIFVALFIAFIFMGIVVFIYFRTFIPSIAVILSAFSDIIVTVAIVNIVGMKIGTAGIAAFLMLIGYSVDTDILLSTKVLKRKEGSVFDRTLRAMKTGMTMTITTIIAVLVAFVFTQSEVIKQIMTILIIGLLVDLINTWIQNTGLLRLYMERKHKE